MTKQVINFKEIISKYDAFFVDIWGVVHDGMQVYHGVSDTLNTLLSTKKVIFLSNAPRPAEVILTALQQYGIKASVENILTSGDITRMYLQKHVNKKIYHIGEEKNHDILRDINMVTVSDINDADLVLLSAYLDEPEKDNKFDDLLKNAQARNLQMLCANPDTYVPHGDHVRRCSGVIAARYEAIGGKVDYFGKPYHKIFEAAMDRSGVAKDKILMIGDTFDTDVLGAKNFGIDVAMTLTGNGSKFYSNLDSFIEEHGVVPTWVIEGVAI